MTMAKKKAKPKKNPYDQCKDCLPAKCCLYVAMEIDEPETRNDFDYLLWKIAHKKVSFYIHRRKWHIRFESRCEFLKKHNKCGIYDTRPKVCRIHSIDTCEYHSDEYEFDVHFKTYEQLRVYIKKDHPRWRI